MPVKVVSFIHKLRFITDLTDNQLGDTDLPLGI